MVLRYDSSYNYVSSYYDVIFIKGPDDVAKMGIAEYNKLCRGIVMTHAEDWRYTVMSHMI